MKIFIANMMPVKWSCCCGPSANAQVFMTGEMAICLNGKNYHSMPFKLTCSELSESINCCSRTELRLQYMHWWCGKPEIASTENIAISGLLYCAGLW